MPFREMLMVAALVLPSMSFAQIVVTEQRLPPLLDGILNADIYDGRDGTFHILGTAEEGWINGIDIEFNMVFPPSLIPTTTVFADTGTWWTDGIHGQEDRFRRAVGFDSNGALLLCWTRQRATMSDIQPWFSLAKPHLNCIRQVDDQVSDVFDAVGAANPVIAVGPDNTAYFVWEHVQSVRSDSNYVAYSSQLRYRIRHEDGSLTLPITFEDGYTPRLATVLPGEVHVIWLTGDSSTARNFDLGYARIVDGQPTPAEMLWRKLNLPLDLSLFVDSSGAVFVGWSEERMPYYRKIFVLHYEDGGVSVDSSDSYTGARHTQFEVEPGGAVHVLWAVGVGYNGSLYYSNSRNGPLFSEVHTISDAAFTSIDPLAILIGPNENPGCVFATAGRIYYVNDLVSSRYHAVSTSAGEIPYGTVHPVFMDSNEDVWVVYGRNMGPHYQFDPWRARFSREVVSVGQEEPPSETFALEQNYPNPFNPSTTISFSLPRSAEVSIKIFNLLGEEVAALISGQMDAGNHAVSWDATGEPSGVYFYRLEAGGHVETRKLMLLR